MPYICVYNMVLSSIHSLTMLCKKTPEKQLNEFLKKGKIAIIEPSLARFTASSVKKQ